MPGKTVVKNQNLIATGYNNYSGLQNIELIEVGGFAPDTYLPSVVDKGLYRDGLGKVTGDGIERTSGFESTQWRSDYLGDNQWYWLYANILRSSRSGPVTIQTRKYAVPLDSIMSNKYIIVNAILTLLPAPDTDRRDIAGYNPFFYNFTRIDPNGYLHEDKMYGEIVVNAGSTSQDNIGTTPELFTGFATAGENDGVTVTIADDSLTIILDGKYEVQWDLEAVADASHKWTFTIFKNGATTGVATSETISTVEKTISFGRTLDLEAGDIITPFVNSDDGGDTADITAINGRLSLTRK